MERRPLVCLSASGSWYGSVIREMTHSNVNHAFIAYYDEAWGGWQALQTDERGVVEVTMESLHHKYVECYDFKYVDLLTALPSVRELIGDKYDYWGIVGQLLKLAVWRIAGRKILNPLHRSGELFCSEFCTTFLQRVCSAPAWINYLHPSNVAPGGKEKFLGTLSLQEVFADNSEDVQRVPCPWRSDHDDEKNS